MSEASARRDRRSRPGALEIAASGTYPGTKELALALISESIKTPAWRPVRAATVMAHEAARTTAIHRHMTTQEFVDWIVDYKARRGAQIGNIVRLVGIKPTRRAAIFEGAPIEKAEALAIAHYRTGLPLPISELSGAALADWFLPRFGGVRAVSRALGLSTNTIADQMRGYAMTSVGRVERQPDVKIVRALDWCWRMGAISPYGDRYAAPAFPGQLVEEP